MKLFSSFRKSPIKEHAAKAIIELVYAGNDMAAHLVMQDGRDYSCVCGMIAGPVENPAHHHNFCPVARFYAAVEAAHATQTLTDSSDVDRDCEALRDGTPRYSTPREDVIVLGVLAVICTALIGLCVHFAQKAGLPW
jgi:hypothetical protein